MNDSLIRTFCESPRRSLIVASVTTVVALGLLIPLADDVYNRTSRCDVLAGELAKARQTAASIPQLEKRVSGLTLELEALESRAIDQESIAAYRSEIVDIVRASGCEIRRLEVGKPLARPWTKDDNALQGAKATADKPTGFVLERRTLDLAVDGTMAEVHVLLQRLEEAATLAHPRSLRIQPAARGGTSVTLELELWLFDLNRRRA